jgi:uncharacterized phage-associated protein
MYSARTIAKWFVAWADADEDGDGNLTNLKLQKLLYYAQGHRLAQTGASLFEDQIQAWKHGPVVKTVYQEWRSEKAGELHLTDDDLFEFDEVDTVTTGLLIDVWERYGSLAAWVLRDLTHSEPPWRDSYEPDVNDIVISPEVMKRYFESLYPHGR